MVGLSGTGSISYFKLTICENELREDNFIVDRDVTASQGKCTESVQTT